MIHADPAVQHSAQLPKPDAPRSTHARPPVSPNERPDPVDTESPGYETEFMAKNSFAKEENPRGSFIITEQEYRVESLISTTINLTNQKHEDALDNRRDRTSHIY